MSAPVFLLSDFGLDDVYVGVLHAVIANDAPGAPVHDLLHRVPPQDLLGARLQLAAALPYLPDGAVVCAVVDPGVGSDRRGVAVHARRDGRTLWLIAPDNGLATALLTRERPPFGSTLQANAAWQLARANDTTAAGTTFDGRDLFAPAAARLARGDDPATLGDPIDPDTLVTTPAPALGRTGDGGTRGRVVWIDRFGDLVSDVPAPERYRVRLGSLELDGPLPSFASVEPGAPVTYVGSVGTVEIAIRDGSAAATVGAAVGDELDVTPLP